MIVQVSVVLRKPLFYSFNFFFIKVKLLHWSPFGRDHFFSHQPKFPSILAGKYQEVSYVRRGCNVGGAVV